MSAAVVKTAIWREEKLYVVEDIPAQVCGGCMEQYYSEDVTEALRRMTGAGFEGEQPVREIAVAVYSLNGLNLEEN